MPPRLGSGGAPTAQGGAHLPDDAAGLLALSDWLARTEVTHVALESTGVYWKPVWNVLEGDFELLLFNAHHVKQVPGRKTHVPTRLKSALVTEHNCIRFGNEWVDQRV